MAALGLIGLVGSTASNFEKPSFATATGFADQVKPKTDLSLYIPGLPAEKGEEKPTAFTPAPQPNFSASGGIPVVAPLDIANRQKLLTAGQEVWRLNREKQVIETKAAILKIISGAKNYAEKEQIMRSLYYHADLAAMAQQTKALERQAHIVERNKAILFDNFKAEEEQPIITREFLQGVMGSGAPVGYSSTLTDNNVSVDAAGNKFNLS